MIAAMQRPARAGRDWRRNARGEKAVGATRIRSVRRPELLRPDPEATRNQRPSMVFSRIQENVHASLYGGSAKPCDANCPLPGQQAGEGLRQSAGQLRAELASRKFTET